MKKAVETGHVHSTINETSSENQLVSVTNVVRACMVFLYPLFILLL